MSTAISLTHLAQRFLQPRNSTQRVYEALRAFCVDRVPAREAAQRSLYRMLACRVGNGYEKAKSRHLFADFIDASAQVYIGAGDIEVRFHKRAHNPYLLSAEFEKTDQVIPWLGKKRLRLAFG